MMECRKIFVGLLVTGMWLVLQESCTHDPFLVDDTPMDDTPIDNPCVPGTVYFDRDVMPILAANCALSGCHDAITARNGVNLTTYDRVISTADVRANDLDGSDLYEVLVETAEDKKMPPPPASIPVEQIQIIMNWILQGAENLTCAEDEICDLVDVSYRNNVIPILQTSCIGCHSGTEPSGGLLLDTYVSVKTLALSGQLYGALAWISPYSRMPQGGDQLPECKIDQIKAWIDDGALDN